MINMETHISTLIRDLRSAKQSLLFFIVVIGASSILRDLVRESPAILQLMRATNSQQDYLPYSYGSQEFRNKEANAVLQRTLLDAANMILACSVLMHLLWMGLSTFVIQKGNRTLVLILLIMAWFSVFLECLEIRDRMGQAQEQWYQVWDNLFFACLKGGLAGAYYQLLKVLSCIKRVLTTPIAHHQRIFTITHPVEMEMEDEAERRPPPPPYSETP